MADPFSHQWKRLVWTGNVVLQNSNFYSLALLVRPRSFTFWPEVWNKDVLGLQAASYRAPTKDSTYITVTRCLSSLAKSITSNLFNSANFPSFSKHQRQVLIKIILKALNDVNSYTIKAVVLLTINVLVCVINSHSFVQVGYPSPVFISLHFLPSFMQQGIKIQRFKNVLV